MATLELSSSEMEQAVAWRRMLHAKPELAYEEHATAAFVAERLAEWGFQVRTGIGRTGVVGTLSRGTSRRAIAIRADMDALPIVEETGVPYASTAPGVMHACGHDGHVAVALAAARASSRMTGLDGTVHFVFQPAEEVEGGALEMVRDGLFRDCPADRVFGLHNWPALETGCVVARDGAMMAAFATFEIAVSGRGSHGAMPHEGADPVAAAAQVVSALQTVASRNVSPLDSAVVSVTQIHGGDAYNVIPETVILRGTTRWFDPAVGDLVERRVSEVAAGVAGAMGCAADVDYIRRYPATINDPAAAAFARAAAAGPAGLRVVDAAPGMAAEDFAFMLAERPGCYLWLGSRRDGENPGLHSPRFDFNDAIIPDGVRLWTALVAASLRA